MAKIRSRHVCRNCGHAQPAWSGRCPDCGEWNTLEEAGPEAASPSRDGAAARRGAPAAAATPLREVEAARAGRLVTGIGELDRVLGGGIVPGSLILLGGAPGIGKSTLTGMLAGNLSAAGHRALYVSGEESVEQVRLRAERLGEAALEVPAIAESSLDVVLATIGAERPDVCVIDSIQTLHSSGLNGAPGSVGQVRECANALAAQAKRSGSAVILVGHVTKEGGLAGPRVLEHLVDCVLRFDGESERTWRTLRAVKNRFGATSEVGVFEMRAGGLVQVPDPSARFVDGATGAVGSVVLASMEGTRAVLVEVQALVSPSELEVPRRVVNGIDRSRLSMVLAVLARHARLGLGGADVFVNVTGGVRIEEPGADLAIALAVASAQRGEPLSGTNGRPPACFGELGLTGDLRQVAHAELRVAEAVKFGLDPVITPAGEERLPGSSPCGTIGAAIGRAFPRRDAGAAPAAA